MSKFDDDVVELAKCLYCATMAFQQKITYEEAWKHYISPIPNRKPADIYLESAKTIWIDKVTRDIVEKM